MTTETATEIDLITPITDDWWPHVWEWMQQYPDMNFDDEGAKTTFDSFVAQHHGFMAQGERTWGVTLDGRKVGYGAFMPLNRRLGMTHGIIFDRSVHGQGVAREAVRRVIVDIFSHGFEKIQAFCYADNIRLRRMMKALGGVEEGWLKAQATRRGVPVDVVMVAVFRGGQL